MLHVSWRFTAVLDIFLHIGYATDIYRYSTKTPRLKEADVQTRRRRLGPTVLQLFSMGRCPIRSRCLQMSPVPSRLLEYGFTCCCTRCLAEDSCSKLCCSCSENASFYREIGCSGLSFSAQNTKATKVMLAMLKVSWRERNALNRKHEGIMNRRQALRPEEFSAPCHSDSWGFVCETNTSDLSSRRSLLPGASMYRWPDKKRSSLQKSCLVWAIIQKKSWRTQKRSDLDIYWGISGLMIILYNMMIYQNNNQ